MKTNISKNISRILKLVFAIAVILIFSAESYSEPKVSWVSRFNSYDKNDKAMAMTTDKDGFVYLTGYTEDKNGGKDFLTIKYSPFGKELWTAVYSGISNMDGDDDIANAIAADQYGNVFVTGSTHSGVRGTDFCTIKYGSQGEQLWINFFSGFGSLEDSDEEATSIAVDEFGSAIVTGHSNGGGTGYDFHTIKYSPKGEILWQISFDRQIGLDDKPVSVKTDNQGNVFVTGFSQDMNYGRDYATVKYSKSGKELWHAFYNGIGGNIAINEDEARSLAIDKEGNAYVTGYSYGAGTGKDFLTIKYDANGKEEWISRVNNAPVQRETINDDEANALALDEAGNVYVTGKTVSSEGESDYYTALINYKGETKWAKNYSSEDFGGLSDDGALALAVDRIGSVFVTGYTTGYSLELSCGYSKAFTTVKYTSEGNIVWVKNYTGTERFENSDDIAKGILLDGKGGIFVMGESMGDETEIDYCLIKYEDESRVRFPAGTFDRVTLSDNYPNPFNPVTVISFNVPVSSKVKLAIYDITGREVALLENNVVQAGSHKYEWNASQFSSGTYFYRIQADGFVQTKRMLLIK